MLKNPEDLKNLMRKSTFAICTRMHAAILAITTSTPFIAVAYEHKSIGLLESLHLTKYCLNLENITFYQLRKKVEPLLFEKNRNEISKMLFQKRNKITSQRNILLERLRLSIS